MNLNVINQYQINKELEAENNALKKEINELQAELDELRKEQSDDPMDRRSDE